MVLQLPLVLVFWAFVLDSKEELVDQFDNQNYVASCFVVKDFHRLGIVVVLESMLDQQSKEYLRAYHDGKQVLQEIPSMFDAMKLRKHKKL